MKFEKTAVWGWEHAIRGMRNPKNSWDRSDSEIVHDSSDVKLGPNDRKLMEALIKAGEPHRKFLRQIFVSVDISAPIYWWSEFDTYRIGVDKNSTSTMHKLSSRPIVESDYEFDLPRNPAQEKVFKKHQEMISALNELMEQYNRTNDSGDFRMLKQGLETSYIQKRTVTLNYEVLTNMVQFRKHHRLSEWSVDFMNWVSSLPNNDLIFLSSMEPQEVRTVVAQAAADAIIEKYTNVLKDTFKEHGIEDNILLEIFKRLTIVEQK